MLFLLWLPLFILSGVNYGEIPHIQGQRSPSKIIAGAAAAQYWSGSCTVLEQLSRQRRRPSKMVAAAAAAAKSLQSCPTLCNPTDGSPPSWDSPGKNTGVGYHCLLQCMKVKSESEIVQSYPTRSDPMDCSLPGSSVRGIFQAGILEWGAIAFSEVLH